MRHIRKHSGRVVTHWAILQSGARRRGHPSVFGGAEDTIITWTDAELETDIALSFQEELGCNYVWCAAYAAAPFPPFCVFTL